MDGAAISFITSTDVKNSGLASFTTAMRPSFFGTTVHKLDSLQKCIEKCLRITPEDILVTELQCANVLSYDSSTSPSPFYHH